MSVAVLHPPDVDAELGRLKDFQRRTAEYVHRRLYLDPDATRRFLVADEVGLGKTMVARGVIAQAIAHLWSDVERIDIVYVCSNSSIARQNLNRLKLHLGQDQDYVSADRLTLLVERLPELASRKVNFISFTPGTSFEMHSRTGTARERVVLLHLLLEHWDLHGTGPVNLLQGTVGRERWRTQVRDAPHLEPSIQHEFHRRVDADPGLRDRFLELADACRGRRTYGDRWDDCVDLVATLRQHLAGASLEALEPDLIILDEFQRFPELLRTDTPGGQLASEMFAYQNAAGTEQARVLLLSATPYKMYTTAEETEDHYQDFVNTVRFLESASDTRSLEDLLAQYREELYAVGEDNVMVPATRDAIEARLRRVMARTERIATTADGGGMVRQVDHTVVPEVGDIRRYAALQRTADHLDVQAGSVVPYWKSIPYPANFMDGYQLGDRLRAAVAGPDGRPLLKDLSGVGALLSRGAWRRYQSIDSGNPRMRRLHEDVVERDAWQLLWIPPTAPYYELGRPFSAPNLRRFTKRLVFSAWTATPKAVAVITSYEAERQMMKAADPAAENTEQTRERTSPLAFRRDGDRPATMSLLTLLYPSATLAMDVDPAVIGAVERRSNGGQVTPTLRRLLPRARQRVEQLLTTLPPGADSGPVDQAWYWAAPLLLDAVHHRKATEAWLEAPLTSSRWYDMNGAMEDDADRLWDRHVDEVRAVLEGRRTLGRRPANLATVLVHVSLGGPATVALRALTRLVPPDAGANPTALRNAAGTIAFGFRSLFSTPEAQALLRGRARRAGPDDEGYWRHVLSYCVVGCLQAVMDEYLHVLVERLGLSDVATDAALAQTAGAAREAVSLRTVPLVTTSISSTGDLGRLPTRIHFCRRLGDDRADSEIRGERIGRVQEAFNSPFWPFVLATTSIGQEGLDFHTYCHAVVHWDLPHNPVDLEQRDGRVHRYKGHAVRKNVADAHAHNILADEGAAGRPWHAMFDMARRSRPHDANDLVPYWVYPGDAAIERHVPVYPVSRDQTRLEALRRSLAIYRMVFGQPRQDDLLEYLRSRLSADGVQHATERWRIDLTPRVLST